jgi:serine/threonine-protein kinase 24/25/MST4
VKKIGSGGFGNVYRGIKRSSNQTVAIKVIDMDETSDDISVITREISALSDGTCCVALTCALCHARCFRVSVNRSESACSLPCARDFDAPVGKTCPQLVSYHGSYCLGTKLWIAMEYVDGGSLLDKVRASQPLVLLTSCSDRSSLFDVNIRLCACVCGAGS